MDCQHPPQTSKHLPILQGMFPNKLFLDAEEIAQILRVSKQHIYNLNSEKKLPLKLLDERGRILVSIVELAEYLDTRLSSTVTSSKEVPLSNPTKDAVVIPKKVGRPRKLSSSRITLAFQHQLSTAIIKEEFKIAYEEFSNNLDNSFIATNNSTNFDDGDGLDVDKLKNEISSSLFALNSHMKECFLKLKLSIKEEERKVRKPI